MKQQRQMMIRKALTADTLFHYANDFARAAEATGEGTSYPTFEMAASHFGTSIRKIEQACEEHTELGYLAPAVARGRPGVGIGKIDRKADWLVEAYRT